jgi:hypothetical protein
LAEFERELIMVRAGDLIPRIQHFDSGARFRRRFSLLP